MITINKMYLKLCLVINVFYIVKASVIDIDRYVISPEINKNLYDLNKADKLFEDFVEKFNKQYKDEKEYNYRFEVFKKNLKDINEKNIEIDDEDDEVFGITEFSDLTFEEFVKDHTGLPEGQLPPKIGAMSPAINENLYDLNEAEKLFEDFVEKFNKQYKDEKEYNYRFEVFKKNLQDINEKNIQIDDEDDEVFGITEFSDLTFEEFVKDHTGLPDGQLPPNATRRIRLKMPMSHVPENWDWRSKKVVDISRNQGPCGSCWAFSAVGVIFGQIAKKYRKQIPLSTQQMVDCFHHGGGCKTGSFPHWAFKYVREVGGLMSETDYPYKGREGKCRFRKERAVAKIVGGGQVSLRNEEELKQLVYTYGPVSIGIYASHFFQLHTTGIASAASLGCSSRDRINHAVLLVGYGIEHGHPYWIIQNSFGATWGEQGFMRIERGKNACNMLGYVATADVELGS